jgi:hypothetical protein
MRSRIVAQVASIARGLLRDFGVPQHMPRLLEQGDARDGELNAALVAVAELEPSSCPSLRTALTHAGVKWHWFWRDRSRPDAHIRA